MRLLVDIGNTRCKWALARDTTLVETGVVSRADAEDWTAALPQCPVESIHVSSVAQPEALSRLRAFAAELGVDLSAAESKARFAGLTNAYREPERLGVDRWMACIAAQARGEGAVLFEQRVVLACLHVVRVRTLSSMISAARMDLTKSGFSWTPGQGFYVDRRVTRIFRLTW